MFIRLPAYLAQGYQGNKRLHSMMYTLILNLEDKNDFQ